MSEELQKLLQQIFFTVFGSLIGAVLSSCVGLYIFNRKRIRDAKDEFAAVISKNLGSINKQGVAAYYEKTKPEIREAVFRLRRILNKAQRSELNMIWREYDAIIPHDILRQENESDHIQEFSKTFPDDKPLEKPSNILTGFFLRFERLVE